MPLLRLAQSLKAAQLFLLILAPYLDGTVRGAGGEPSAAKGDQAPDPVPVPLLRLAQGLKAAPLSLLILAPYLDGPVKGAGGELSAAKGDQAQDLAHAPLLRLAQGVKAAEGNNLQVNGQTEADKGLVFCPIAVGFIVQFVQNVLIIAKGFHSFAGSLDGIGELLHNVAAHNGRHLANSVKLFAGTLKGRPVLYVQITEYFDQQLEGKRFHTANLPFTDPLRTGTGFSLFEDLTVPSNNSNRFAAIKRIFSVVVLFLRWRASRVLADHFTTSKYHISALLSVFPYRTDRTG